jgi:hypothetical protein
LVPLLSLGPAGIGKTAFIDTVGSVITQLDQMNPTFNVYVFRNKSSSFSSSEPFETWIPIIKRMLMAVGKTIL